MRMPSTIRRMRMRMWMLVSSRVGRPPVLALLRHRRKQTVWRGQLGQPALRLRLLLRRH